MEAACRTIHSPPEISACNFQSETNPRWPAANNPVESRTDKLGLSLAYGFPIRDAY